MKNNATLKLSFLKRIDMKKSTFICFAIVITPSVSCSTKKIANSTKYIFTHTSKSTNDYYKDDTDCSAKAGQATPELAQPLTVKNSYGQDVYSNLAATADNMESRGRYEGAAVKYLNIKNRCMAGNGWLRETEEEYSKRKQGELENKP